MQKIFLLVILFSFSSLAGIAQDNKEVKREAKKVAKTVNKSLDKITEAVEDTDWSSLSDLINTTVKLIEVHSDAILEIANNIDTQKLERAAEAVASKVENSEALKKLDEELNRVAEKIEKAVEEDR